MTILGWGYQGRSLEEMLTTFQSWSVRSVIDVRLNPVSRKAGYSKKRLASALEGIGIAYVHMPELGNPQDNRAGFATPELPAGASARDRFTTEVLSTDGARQALLRINELAAAGNVVLLCFEASERCCHRALVRAAAQAAEVPANA